MVTDRRSFLMSSAAAGAFVAAGGSLFARQDARVQMAARPAPEKKLHVLVMGGTAFLGPHCVEQLLARGHKVTLFNRGKTNPGLFPDLEKLVGDRRNDVKALEGRKFDAVLDTNGYFPRFVKTPLEVLKANIGHYVFVSTVSVYARMGEIDIDESSEVLEISAEDAEKAADSGRIGADYGPLKVACERAAEELMPGKVTVVRPGLIVGPDDPTDRFTYWPARIAEGGEVIAPGKPEWEIQIVDVRDVAGFCVLALEKQLAGTFNVDGLEKPVPMGTVLDACVEVSKSDAKLTWVDHTFLAEHDVQAWRDLPAWFPPAEGKDRVASVSCKKAIDAGLTFLPIQETVRGALEFHRKRPEGQKPRWTLTREREAEVLKAWAERK